MATRKATTTGNISIDGTPEQIGALFANMISFDLHERIIRETREDLATAHLAMEEELDRMRLKYENAERIKDDYREKLKQAEAKIKVYEVKAAEWLAKREGEAA